MSGDMTTRLDVPYGQQAATRQAAARFLLRKGHGDLLDVLGLVDADALPQALHPDEGLTHD